MGSFFNVHNRNSLILMITKRKEGIIMIVMCGSMDRAWYGACDAFVYHSYRNQMHAGYVLYRAHLHYLISELYL
jgi:hypothetical protein